MVIMLGLGISKRQLFSQVDIQGAWPNGDQCPWGDSFGFGGNGFVAFARLGSTV